MLREAFIFDLMYDFVGLIFFEEEVLCMRQYKKYARFQTFRWKRRVSQVRAPIFLLSSFSKSRLMKAGFETFLLLSSRTSENKRPGEKKMRQSTQISGF